MIRVLATNDTNTGAKLYLISVRINARDRKYGAGFSSFFLSAAAVGIGIIASFSINANV
jgi:hypothetical protein